MRTIHIYITVLLAAAMLALASACGSTPSDKPIVTVSIEPQKFLLEKITGDRIDIRTLISNGANPEMYDPTVNHLMNLSKSIAFLRIGNIGFEEAILDKVRAENPKLPIINTSVGIEPILGTHTMVHDGHVHGEGDVDPHTWTSVRNARVILKNMLDAMVKLDPKGRETYEKNYQAYDEVLRALDAQATEALAGHRGEAFVVWHPSLSYLARDYGLEQVVAGNVENKELSATSFKDVIDEAREHGISKAFYQKDFDARQMKAVADEVPGLQMTSINPLNPDWETEIRAIIDVLAE